MPDDGIETSTIRDEDHGTITNEITNVISVPGNGNEENAKNKITNAAITVPVPVILHKSAIDRMTRLFAWLTACLTISAVLISLVFVTRDRDELRAQIFQVSRGLECRAKAATDVNQGITDEQVALAGHAVIVGEFVAIVIRVPKDNPSYVAKMSELAGRLDIANAQLATAEVRLQQSVDAQKEALRVCKLG